uniref:Uncharacterized protein n=1 Tax=Brassica oleracea TaxID=3712 RepID=A0A3P6EJI6_BRAOL|nr:unnamed protein product [Brassica oleracea]
MLIDLCTRTVRFPSTSGWKMLISLMNLSLNLTRFSLEMKFLLQILFFRTMTFYRVMNSPGFWTMFQILARQMVLEPMLKSRFRIQNFWLLKLKWNCLNYLEV